MKNAVLITTETDGSKTLTYNMGTINLNGIPLIEEKKIKFICSNCSKKKECPQMQKNGGSKIGGTSMGCMEFDLKKDVLGS